MDAHCARIEGGVLGCFGSLSTLQSSGGILKKSSLEIEAPSTASRLITNGLENPAAEFIILWRLVDGAQAVSVRGQSRSVGRIKPWGGAVRFLTGSLPFPIYQAIDVGLDRGAPALAKQIIAPPQTLDTSS